MNIYEKLLEVRRSVDYLQKESKGAQYSYVSSSQVLSAVRKKMNEVGLLLIPEITESCVKEKEELKPNNKVTITYFTELHMKMTWINANNPDEKIICPWYAQGVDIAGEKGVGKALTYGEKYFMLKFFNIPTDKDDPDSFQKKNDPVSETTQEKALGDIEKARKLITGCQSQVQLNLVKNQLNSFKWTDLNIQELQALVKDKTTELSESLNV